MAGSGSTASSCSRSWIPRRWTRRALPRGFAALDFRSSVEAAKRDLQSNRNFSLDETLQRWERSYVEAALALTNGNLSQAAKLLGIHRTTLYSRMQNYAPVAETQKG